MVFLIFGIIHRGLGVRAIGERIFVLVPAVEFITGSGRLRQFSGVFHVPLIRSIIGNRTTVRIINDVVIDNFPLGVQIDNCTICGSEILHGLTIGVNHGTSTGSSPSNELITGSGEGILRQSLFNVISEGTVGHRTRTAVCVILNGVSDRSPVSGEVLSSRTALSNRNSSLSSRTVAASPTSEGITRLGRIIQRECCSLHSIGSRVGLTGSQRTTIQVIGDAVDYRLPLSVVFLIFGIIHRGLGVRAIGERIFVLVPAVEFITGSGRLRQFSGVFHVPLIRSIIGNRTTVRIINDVVINNFPNGIEVHNCTICSSKVLDRSLICIGSTSAVSLGIPTLKDITCFCELIGIQAGSYIIGMLTVGHRTRTTVCVILNGVGDRSPFCDVFLITSLALRHFGNRIFIGISVTIGIFTPTIEFITGSGRLRQFSGIFYRVVFVHFVRHFAAIRIVLDIVGDNLPLSIQGDRTAFSKVLDRSLICIGSTSAVSLGIPTLESITLSGKGICREILSLIIGQSHTAHCTGTAVGIEIDNVSIRFPNGIEVHDLAICSSKVLDRSLVCVGSTSAVSLGIPVLEGITRLGELIGIQVGSYIICMGAVCHCTNATVGIVLHRISDRLPLSVVFLIFGIIHRGLGVRAIGERIFVLVPAVEFITGSGRLRQFSGVFHVPLIRSIVRQVTTIGIVNDIIHSRRSLRSEHTVAFYRIFKTQGIGNQRIAVIPALEGVANF